MLWSRSAISQRIGTDPVTIVSKVNTSETGAVYYPQTNDITVPVHVPEPGSLALLVLGLAGIGIARKVRR